MNQQNDSEKQRSIIKALRSFDGEPKKQSRNTSVGILDDITEEEENIDNHLIDRLMNDIHDSTNFIRCTNCGDIGHYQNNCPYPILSYGIAVWKREDGEPFKVLQIQRRDSGRRFYRRHCHRRAHV